MCTKAAQYLRVSTGRQRCSLAAQSMLIEAYAVEHGIQIVRTYSDGGRSGLDLKGRPALQQLLVDVHDPHPAFNLILVYDVSRWGRFQDVDEGVFYEHLCKRAGAPVVYVAERDSGQPATLAQIIKAVRRIMAAEFSRELSQKTYRGHVKLAKEGFLQGGPPSYGLRRMLVDAEGQPRGPLLSGERKSFATDRTILIPGPPEEVAVVRRIFHQYGELCWPVPRICASLYREGVLGPSGRAWTKDGIRCVLRNERYAGVMVYGRISQKLRSAKRRNPRSDWIRSHDAIAPIVSAEAFAKARTLSRMRRGLLTDQEMLAPLRLILQREGRLTTTLINAEPGIVTAPAYLRKFKSIHTIRALLDYGPQGPERETGQL